MATDFLFQGDAPFMLTFERVWAEGRILPRVQLSFRGQPVKEQSRVDVEQLRAEVWADGELLGIGGMRELSTPLLHHGGTLQVVVPISREVLVYIDERSRSDHISLRIDLRAEVRWRHESDGQVEGWADGKAFSQGTITIARSDWILNVVGPLAMEEFLLMELAIPPYPDGERWKEAARHLAEAELFYHEGDDPEVLRRCFAALQALADTPAHGLVLEWDPVKRARLDDALSAVKSYLNSGRRVSSSPVEQDIFSVDHRDAAFALGQTKVWLSYVARASRASS